MEYKRKVTTKQEGVDGFDTEFGKLKMVTKSKRLMPLVFAGIMLVFVLGIFASGVVDIPGNLVATCFGIAFIIIGLIQLSFVTDHIHFYEYGMVDYTFLNLRKKRLAYDEIEAIVEVKHRKFRKNSNPIVAMWKIVPKKRKGSITIDATSYIGITNILTSVRHDTKIKNISD